MIAIKERSFRSNLSSYFSISTESRKHSLLKSPTHPSSCVTLTHAVQLLPAENPTRSPASGGGDLPGSRPAHAASFAVTRTFSRCRADPRVTGPTRHTCAPTGNASPTSRLLGPAPHHSPRPRHVTAEIINFRCFTTSFHMRPSVRYLLFFSLPVSPLPGL